MKPAFRSTGHLAMATQLALALVLLLGSVELHSHGWQHRDPHATSDVFLQLADCAGLSAHLEAAGKKYERHCPSCLHRLSNAGSVQAGFGPAAPLDPCGDLIPDSFLASSDGRAHPLAARGPPSAVPATC